jgi:hypothetical protein
LLVLGLALFLLFDVAGDPGEAPVSRIEVNEGQVAQLVEIFTRARQRPPTEEELRSLIDDHVREEIYYREALAMGLDRDDTIVRRRLRQKLEFLTDDVVGVVDPTEEDLVAYHREHADVFRLMGQLSFRHVYFSRDRRGEAGLQDAASTLLELKGAGDSAITSDLGDPMLMPAEYDLVADSEIAGSFGDAFVDALATLPVESWEGPVESAYGWHLVLIRERHPGVVRPLEQVRHVVEREWRNAQRREATEAYYRKLLERYDVHIAPLTTSDGEGPRVAELDK